jgi:hypothetical protein
MSEWLTLIKSSDCDLAAQHQRAMFVKFVFPAFVILMCAIVILLPVLSLSDFWIGVICLVCLGVIGGAGVLIARLKLNIYFAQGYTLSMLVLAAASLCYLVELIGIIF